MPHLFPSLKRTAVVILNYNGKGFLSKFLPGVIQHSSNDADIYVADNASTDDSVSFLKENFPGVKIILNNTNGGFAKGYNDCLQQIKAEYYILLNSDIEVTPKWINPVIELMDKDHSIAAVQPKILSYNKPDEFEHAGASGGFIDRNGFPFCRGRIFTFSEKDNGQYDDAIPVFWASGACMFVRADLFHNAGGFDNDFFAHMEEIDLCWRLQKMGFKIYVQPQSKVYHVGGGTLSYMSPRKTYLNFRNNLFLIYKNYNSGALFLMMLKRLCLDGVAGVKFVCEGNFKHMIAILKAHFHYYRALSSLKKKRKQVMALTTNNEIKGVYSKWIIIDFYFRKKKKYSDLKM